MAVRSVTAEQSHGQRPRGPPLETALQFRLRASPTTAFPTTKSERLLSERCRDGKKCDRDNRLRARTIPHRRDTGRRQDFDGAPRATVQRSALRVGAANDPLDREADDAADEVMHALASLKDKTSPTSLHSSAGSGFDGRPCQSGWTAARWRPTTSAHSTGRCTVVVRSTAPRVARWSRPSVPISADVMSTPARQPMRSPNGSRRVRPRWAPTSSFARATTDRVRRRAPVCWRTSSPAHDPAGWWQDPAGQ